MLHRCVKEALGKPDMYITVAITKAEYVSVVGKAQSVVVQLDSIGGSLGEFTKQVCAGLKGVEADKITCTFRSVSGKEFAMNGATIF